MITSKLRSGDGSIVMTNLLFALRSLRPTRPGLTPFAGQTVQMTRFKTIKGTKKPLLTLAQEIYFFLESLSFGGDKEKPDFLFGFIQTGTENPCLCISSQKGKSRLSISRFRFIINHLRGVHYHGDPQRGVHRPLDMRSRR